MIIHLKIIGSLLVLLAFAHTIFPKYFDWKNQLKALSLINKQLMFVHTFFIAITVLFMGLLCLFFANDIINTNFGKHISLGLGIFWSLRLIFQLFIYSPKLWKGKAFETTVHVAFTLLWFYFTCIFFLASFQAS